MHWNSEITWEVFLMYPTIGNLKLTRMPLHPRRTTQKHKNHKVCSTSRQGVFVITLRVRSTMGGYVFTGVTLQLVYPSPSHNTSNHWSHVLSGGTPVTCPRSLPGGGTPVPCGGYPSSMQGVPRTGVPPNQGRTRVPIPLPAGQELGPPPQDRICLDRLCCRQYASCDFRQEDCLVSS